MQNILWEFLKDFHGTLLTVAYSVYDPMNKKSKYYICKSCQTIPEKKLETIKDMIAYQALKQIAAIYHLDNELSRGDLLNKGNWKDSSL